MNLERRAADTLWRELRGALLAEVREINGLGRPRVRIEEGSHLVLRLETSSRRLDVRPTREVVHCTMWLESDRDTLTEVPIGLHPGATPSYRLNGHPQPAQIIAAKLLAALLEHESSWRDQFSVRA